MTDQFRITPEEIAQLSDVLADAVADKVAEKVAARIPVHTCPFDEDVRVELTSIGRRSLLVKTAIANRITDFIVYGTLTLLILGIIHWVRERAGQ